LTDDRKKGEHLIEPIAAKWNWWNVLCYNRNHVLWKFNDTKITQNSWNSETEIL